MGGGGSKSKPGSAPVALPTSANTEVASSPESDSMKQYHKYKEFRDELLAFSLGESAYDFAEQLFTKQPDDPEVMALLAETAVLYDETKNKMFRDHWCDRLDLLQRGVDVSRKCIKENPEYGPCYRTYVMAATRESEALYYVKSFIGFGLVENYKAIMRRGEEGLKLLPKDAEIPNSLGAVNARCAYYWYEPSRWYSYWYGLPNRREMLTRSIKYHKIATENDPDNLEYACRLAQAYYQLGDYPNARRWYVKVRDEMPPQKLSDDKWQGLAHTQLSTSFQKSKWNVPFG